MKKTYLFTLYFKFLFLLVFTSAGIIFHKFLELHSTTHEKTFLSNFPFSTDWPRPPTKICFPNFDINLLNNVHNPNNEFLDSLASNSFLPYILQPTRITSRSSTLIDNIFRNIILPDSISGNLSAAICNCLPQFPIVPNIFSNPPSNKSNIYERDWSNFDQENVILDYFLYIGMKH